VYSRARKEYKKLAMDLYAMEAERQSRLPAQPVRWTDHDNEVAKRHGWQVTRAVVGHYHGFPIYGHYVILGAWRMHDARFRDDPNVLQFVTRIAEQGDDLAERALALVVWSKMICAQKETD
jgi:hypothetical protein